MRCPLLLRKLQIGDAGANQHRGSAEQLTNCFAEIVLNVDARLRIANRVPQAISLTFWQLPPQPPPPANRHHDSPDGEVPGPYSEKCLRSDISPEADAEADAGDRERADHPSLAP